MRCSRYLFEMCIMFGLCFVSACYCQKKNRTSVDRIRSAGFKSEVHNVATVDGYVLTIFRIVASQNNETKTVKRKHPILIQHGLMASSDCFIHDKDGLGFVLARDNWDVWLGNIRGNYYSRQHNRISPNGTKFWNYSWHDMGQKDITAMIDYILKHTGRPRLNYIGHSMGTTMFYVMSSTMTSYNKKINTMVSLAPIGRMSKWALIFNNTTFMYQDMHGMLMKYLRQKKVEGFPRYEKKGMSKHQVSIEDLESYYKTTFEIVTWIVNKLSGDDAFPDGTSVRTLLHFIQNIGSVSFQRFDYGSRERNIKAWGSETPPPYNLNKVQVPVAVYYTVADEMASEQDSEYMVANLPNVIMKMRIASMSFSHADFCFTTAKENLILRQKMHASIINVLKQRDGSNDENIAKKACQNNKDCDTKSYI